MLQVKEMKRLVHSAPDSMSVHKVCGVCLQAWLSELSRSQADATSAAWSKTHRHPSYPPIANHSASAKAVGSKPRAEAAAQVAASAAAQVAAPAAANIAATTASAPVNDAVREVSCVAATALLSARADSPAAAPATAAPAASAPAPSASDASIALACLGSAAAHTVLVSSSEPLSGPNPVPDLSALPGPLTHLRPEVHSSNAQRAADAITASQTADAVPVSTAKESQPQEESFYPLETSQQQVQPQQQVSTSHAALLNTTAIACGPSKAAEGQGDGIGDTQAQQTAASTSSEGSEGAREGRLYPFPTHRSPQDSLAGIVSSSPCAEEDSSHEYVFGRRHRTSADQNMPDPSVQAVPVPDLSKPTEGTSPGTLMQSLHSRVAFMGSRAAVDDSQAASLHDPAESPDVQVAPSGCQTASKHMPCFTGDSAAVMEAAATDTSGLSLAPQAATAKASGESEAAPAGITLTSADASKLDATAMPVASIAGAVAESQCSEAEELVAALSASASQPAAAADAGPPAAALAAATEAAPVVRLSSASAASVDDPVSMTPTLHRITHPSLPKKRKKSKYFSETFEVKKRRRNKTQRTKAENRAARAAGVALPSRASPESICVHSSSWSGDSVSHVSASAQKHTGDSSRLVS